MKHEDFYSGEPVESGSPNFFQSPSNVIDTGATNQEVEAANMASFGRYDYDPAARAAMIQTAPVPLSGGGYGGYFNPYQQPPYGGGIGAPPPWYGPGYSPWGNPQPSYQYYRPYQQQSPPQMPTQYTIPPLSFGNEFLPNADFQEQLDKMQVEFYMRQQDIEAKQAAERQNSAYGSPYGYGYNYYGIPYYNPYQYNSLIKEYSSKLDAMKQEAQQRRTDFNIRLSQVAHNLTRGKLSEDDIREMYTGKTVEIPQANAPEIYYGQMRFAQMQPFDNSQMYRDYYAAIKREYDQIIPPDSNLKETFENMAVLQAKWDLDEEEHRRRNGATQYESGNAYKYYVRKKARERYAQGNATTLPAYPGMPMNFNPSGMAGSYVAGNPVLSKSTTLADDGTLNVSISLPANVGSHKGEVYTVTNSNEAEYEAKRERFGRFLDSIPGNIYLDQQKQKKLEEWSG